MRLAGTDQGGRSLELLDGEQPQRVAHEHSDTVARRRARRWSAAAAAWPACRRSAPGRPRSCRRPWGTRAGRPSRSPPSARSGCAGSASAGRLSRTKASWNGRQERFSGVSLAASAWSRFSALSLARSSAASVWTRCRYIARLAKRNAASAVSSLRAPRCHPRSAARSAGRR